jgi:hypothetical protein
VCRAFGKRRQNTRLIQNNVEKGIFMDPEVKISMVPT